MRESMGIGVVWGCFEDAVHYRNISRTRQQPPSTHHNRKVMRISRGTFADSDAHYGSLRTRPVEEQSALLDEDHCREASISPVWMIFESGWVMKISADMFAEA